MDPPELVRQRILIPKRASLYAFLRHSESRFFVFKQLMDVTLVLLSLIPLAAIFILIAVLIKLDSSGPIIFKQERVGAKLGFLQGSPYWIRRRFTMYKFRTMKNDAKVTIHYEFVKAYITNDFNMSELLAMRKAKSMYKLANDPRVTRMGHFLRKTSLDELPQLWNVLLGDMSLVGPRPPIPYEVEMYKPRHYQRLAALPGITGLWQIMGRSSTTFEEMVALDLEYIQKQSLWLDLKIIFGTLPAILSKRGAR